MNVKHRSDEFGSIVLKKNKVGNFVAETSITQFTCYSTPSKILENALEYLEAAAAREVAQALKFQTLIKELKDSIEKETKSCYIHSTTLN